ncbi:hypothetical protein [Bradyrhizobium lupini]|uniref:hypothetical protein n=1 Tax=Rhizobium lupini TaxID=136996 RepID=UPI0034C64A43
MTPRLTPGPLHLLVSIARGAVLRRYCSDYPFILVRPPGPGDELDSEVSVHARAANTLTRLALVEPIDKFDWRISAAGRAWLAANGIAAKVEKQRSHSRP